MPLAPLSERPKPAELALPNRFTAGRGQRQGADASVTGILNGTGGMPFTGESPSVGNLAQEPAGKFPRGPQQREISRADFPRWEISRADFPPEPVSLRPPSAKTEGGGESGARQGPASPRTADAAPPPARERPTPISPAPWGARRMSPPNQQLGGKAPSGARPRSRTARRRRSRRPRSGLPAGAEASHGPGAAGPARACGAGRPSGRQPSTGQPAVDSPLQGPRPRSRLLRVYHES